MIKKYSMSSQALTPNPEAAFLTRILVPTVGVPTVGVPTVGESDDRELTPDAARYLLSIKLPSSDEYRVDELSAKARAGALTEAESQELDGYLHIGSLVAVLQSTARRLLKLGPSSRQ